MRIKRIDQIGRSRQLWPAPVLCESAKNGQSMIEACLAMFIICLVFFGLFQLSQLAAAREILHHAAACGARAKTVGFNRFMVSKSIRTAAIPNSGRLLVPEFTDKDTTLHHMVTTMRPGEFWDKVLTEADPQSLQYDFERARIPEYLASANNSRSLFILNYEGWDNIHWSTPRNDSEAIEINVSQLYPLRIPLSRAFYASTNVNLNGVSSLENHYPLYLDDNNW